MRISVVLPIYNGEETLSETLKSLYLQTFHDFELIACIDGTNDGSKQILERFRSKFKSLKIIENERNIGLGRTMNRLISNASGEYIAVAEQDDYYYPKRLQLQTDFMDKNPDIGLVSGIAEFWNGQKVSAKFPGLLVHGNQYPRGQDMFLLNYRNQVKVVNSCMLFRKSVHIKNGLYFTQHHPSISVDWTYILRFSLVADIHGLSEVLVRLDRRNDRKSVTSNKEKQFKAAREVIRSFAYEYPTVISKKDYRYAQNTEFLLELGHTGRLRFLFMSIWLIMLNPKDNRFLKKLWRRIKKSK